MPRISLPTPAFLENNELAIFAQSAGRFFEKHATAPELRRWRDEGFVSRDVWLQAGEAGLLGLCVPQEYGGAGVGFEFDAVLIEQMGLKNALNFAIPLHNAVVAPYIVSYGAEAQKQRWLPGVVTGETLLAISMSEPGAGSDLQGLRTTARKDGDSYILNGQKTFVSNGAQANLIIVAAKTDATSGAKGISLFLVDTDQAEGFTRGRLLEKMGQEGRDTAELFFNDVRVPAENLLGREGGGFAMLMEKLPQERLVIAWQAVAMMKSALNLTLDYVTERKAFGRTVFDFQNSQFKLADAATQAMVSEAFLHNCTERLLAGSLDSATASMAKLFTTEAQAKVIDECLQLFGGYGYMLEYPISELYKDARAFRIYGGTSEIMKLLISRALT